MYNNIIIHFDKNSTILPCLQKSTTKTAMQKQDECMWVIKAKYVNLYQDFRYLDTTCTTNTYLDTTNKRIKLEIW